MKITFLVPRPNLSGGARVVAIYADKLRRRGHEVRLVAQPWPRPGMGGYAKAALKGQMPRRRMSTSHYEPLHLPVHVLDRRRPVVDDDVKDGDIVVATWWETAFDAAALSPEKGQKIYFVQHHEVHRPETRNISRGTYFLPLHKITIARWLVETMAETYGDRNVDLIENSVDTEQFHAPEREKNARPTVGFLYSPAPFKGLEIARPALLALRDRMPGLRIIAFGTSPMDKTDPLADIVDYHRSPSQDRIRDVYASCDVWLCASHAEGFHLPPLEAMACRCPVVSTRVGGSVETVVDGTNGYLVDPGDHVALTRRLGDVLGLDAERWRAFSDAAHARAHSYTWDDAADLFEAALLRQIETAEASGATQPMVSSGPC